MVLIKYFLIFTLFLIPGCKSAPNKSAHSTHITPGMAHNLILQQMGNSTFKIIDVRTKQEFETGHIKGAVNIDWNSDQDRLLTLSKKNKCL